MKRLLSTFLSLAALLFLATPLACLAQLPAYNVQIYQIDSTGSNFVGRWFTPASPFSSYFLMYDGNIQQPKVGALGSGLSWDGTTMAVSGVPTSSLSWSGSTSQYVRGDGSLATLPALTVNYGDPAARTLSMSTVYQATDPSKATVVTVSPSCTNTTTVLASSTCTMTVHQSNLSSVSCSTGTVVSTWNSAVPLGLVFTQTSGSPFDIKLGIGRYFIMCPVAGTFTITTAVDQTLG